jgi:hypothetical protein
VLERLLDGLIWLDGWAVAAVDLPPPDAATVALAVIGALCLLAPRGVRPQGAAGP